MPKPMGKVTELLEEYKRAKQMLKDIKDKVELVEERDVQQTSGGTFFVTLPKKWANKVGLQKGNKVMLVWTKDDTITVIS